MEWIALTTAVLAERLGLGKSNPYRIAAETARLKTEFPQAPHAALQTLQKSEAKSEKLLVALKARLLTSNKKARTDTTRPFSSKPNPHK